MRRVALTDSLEWKGRQVDKLFCEALYADDLYDAEDLDGTIWFGSGRYFSVLFRFPNLPEEEIHDLKEKIEVMVNFDHKRVFLDEYQGCIHVRTQPMSLDYIMDRMPWDYLFRVFENWFTDQDDVLIVRVDRRNAKGGEDKRIMEFLEKNWDDFLALMEQVDLQPASCSVSFIRTNLEFKLFRNVTQLKQLLAVLRIVDFLYELGTGSNNASLNDLVAKLETGGCLC